MKSDASNVKLFIYLRMVTFVPTVSPVTIVTILDILKKIVQMKPDVGFVQDIIIKKSAQGNRKSSFQNSIKC